MAAMPDSARIWRFSTPHLLDVRLRLTSPDYGCPAGKVKAASQAARLRRIVAKGLNQGQLLVKKKIGEGRRGVKEVPFSRSPICSWQAAVVDGARSR